MTPAVFRQAPETCSTDLRKAVNTDAEEPGRDVRDLQFFIELTSERLAGDGRTRIPPLTVLAEVIVGQGLEPRKNKRRSIVSALNAPG